MAPTVPKFGLTHHEGADGTAGAVAFSLVAAKCQKTAGEYMISNNFGVMLHCNPARGKSNKPVGADIALAPLNVGRAADTTKMVDPMAPQKVRRLADVAKAADLIPSDNNNGLSDLEIALAAYQPPSP